MHRKCMHSQIEFTKDMFFITVQKNDMYLSYLLLDQLLNDRFDEVYFCDGKSGQKITVRRSREANRTIVEDGCVYMSNNCIECLKQMISQCHVRPYDAEWMHCDIEAYTAQGDDAAMVIRFAAC